MSSTVTVVYVATGRRIDWVPGDLGQRVQLISTEILPPTLITRRRRLRITAHADGLAQARRARDMVWAHMAGSWATIRITNIQWGDSCP